MVMYVVQEVTVITDGPDRELVAVLEIGSAVVAGSMLEELEVGMSVEEEGEAVQLLSTL